MFRDSTKLVPNTKRITAETSMHTRFSGKQNLNKMQGRDFCNLSTSEHKALCNNITIKGINEHCHMIMNIVT